MNFIEAYIQGFKKHYPEKEVLVKSKRHNGNWCYRVVINGDAGDLLLTEQDMRDATRMFNN
jgi:hypothetical protein